MVTIHPLVLALFLSTGGDTVLLDFASDRCEPCRLMEPTVKRLVDEGYPVHKINVDRDPETASRFRVSGVPCFVMLRDGREVDRVVGATSHSRLQQMFATAGYQVAATHDNRSIAPTSHIHTTLPDAPSVRGQSPPDDRIARVLPATRREVESTAPPLDRVPPSADPQEIRQRALQATVRLKIEDANGHSVGSGTIVDAHGSEALVLTCGHIFRDSEGKGRITVDLFAEGSARSVSGHLIRYDLNRDIGLVSIVPNVALEPVRIASGTVPVQRGSAVFSVGCDRGGPPRLLNSQISAIDKYVGPPNVEVIGQPMDGRSGGGLFAADSGRLIGVCNMADPADNEGIYAALATIHWELDRIGLRQIYQSEPSALAADRRHPQAEPTTDAVPPPMPHTMPPTPANGPVRGATPEGLATLAGNGTEVICIIRRHGQQQLFVLDRPTPDLLHMLARESRMAEVPTGIALQPQSGTRSPAAWPNRRKNPNHPDAGKNFRAQSADR
ncbi:MAG: trypsin-like peptidase domain-containing protein [Pirellulaceae bacterium]